MSWTHDVVVVGAGAAGLTAAGGLAQLGLRVALIEAGAMGANASIRAAFRPRPFSQSLPGRRRSATWDASVSARRSRKSIFRA